MILARIGELGANTGLVRMVSRLRALGRTADLRGTLVVAAWPVALIGVALAAGSFVLAPTLAQVFFDEAHRADAVG